MHFSIIIPVYNAEDTIERCLDSIIGQTFNDYECIIIDDGSVDNSSNIIEKYQKKDSRFKMIHKNNEGVSSARNLGIKNAKGKFIIFIDADDFIDKDYLLRFKDYDADVIICGFKYIDKTNTAIFPENSYIEGKHNIANLITENINKSYLRTPWSKAIKAKIIKNNLILFDKKMRFGEDTDFNFRLFKYTNSLKMISYVGYNYYFGNPYSKWILTPKEYKYSIKKILSSIKSIKGVYEKNAINDITNCFMIFFLIGLWNANFLKSLKMSFDYFRYKVYRFCPYTGLFKLRKLLSILAIPYINLFRHVKY